MNNVFKALGDPTRRRILEILGDGDKNAGEIASAFDISKPSVSHHLVVLKNAELVLSTRQGQNIVYTLNATVLQQALKWFMDIKAK